MNQISKKGRNKIIIVVVALIVIILLILANSRIGRRGGQGGDIMPGECGDVVNLPDFDSNTCTRTRQSNIGSLGFHSAGTAFSKSAPLGAGYHRIIISWYTALDDEGNANIEYTDRLFAEAKRNNMGVILSLRSNHPEKSSVSFDPEDARRNFDTPDSLPISKEEWQEYVKTIVNEYENEGLVAVAVLNEFGPQFEPNLPKDHENYDEQKAEDIITLMSWTYEAVKEANPEMPVISPAITGTNEIALAKGFNENGYIYKGTVNTGIKKVSRQEIIDGFEDNAGYVIGKIIVEGAPYYDYIDLHQRVDFPEEIEYVANWLRTEWENADITGKGLISTEIAGPFSYYTEEYHEYMQVALPVTAYYYGFDAITWAPWFKESNFPENFGRVSITDESGNVRQNIGEKVKELTDNTGNFVSVQRINENEFRFRLPNGETNTVNIERTVPIPPEFN